MTKMHELHDPICSHCILFVILLAQIIELQDHLVEMGS